MKTSFDPLQLKQIGPRHGQSYHSLGQSGTRAFVEHPEFGQLVLSSTAESGANWGAWIWKGQLTESAYGLPVELFDTEFNCNNSDEWGIIKNWPCTIGLASSESPNKLMATFTQRMMLHEPREHSAKLSAVGSDNNIIIAPGTHVVVAVILPISGVPSVEGRLKLRPISNPDAEWPVVTAHFRRS